MIRSATITIKFTGWWLGGTGRSGGGGADMIAYRDDWGCPALPMTQVKGTLRDVARDVLTPDQIARLFGDADAAGAVRFAGDAMLPEGDRAFFGASANRAARSALFGMLRSTALDDQGVALAESLRAAEAAVPMTISGRVQWIGTSAPDFGWAGLLDRACAATPSFGKLKNDGYGRATARCEA